jgi:membrane protein
MRGKDVSVTHPSSDRDDAASPRTGEDAGTPRDLSARSWRAVLGRALRHVHESRLPLLSAGVAFFAVLSIAPVLVTAVSVYGAVNSPEESLTQLSDMAEALPPEVETIVADQLRSITTASNQVLTVRGLAGLLIALWTATTAMLALLDALTIAYHETDTRSFSKRLVLALMFVLGGAVLLGAIISLAGFDSQRLADAPAPVRTGAWVVGWLLMAMAASVVLAVLYRFAPDRRDPRWQWTSWGSTGATVLWVAISVALLGYAQTLGTYEATYGSLAGVAISMFWLWVTVLLIVVGAAVNGEAERQTVRDSTVGRERPLGQRGAVVADSTPDRSHEH